jgi:succinoglycan biosynthesis protein ExoM
MMQCRIDIGVCTFRRAHIADTLQSLNHLKREPGWQIRIIVADNDDVPSAQPLVAQMASQMDIPVDYRHAPARNISIARNACLDAAQGDYFAFIDDDEIASPQWLQQLIQTIEQTQADAVLGPVNAVYGNRTPEWMKRGDYHATRPVWVDGEIITGYSCNMLVRRKSSAVAPHRFRLDLGRSGGEDTVYFSEIYQSGGRIVYASEALLTEPVPDNRAALSWLLKRRFRSGQTHGLLLLEEHGTSIGTRLKHCAIAACKLFYCYARAFFTLYDKECSARWLLRGTLHGGVISRLIGKREMVQYGN